MSKILVDFHHSSLLRSLNMLFEERFGYELYRPIGMEWWTEGFWAINDQPGTAKQFLSLEQAYVPGDGTPPLNIVAKSNEKNGEYVCLDAGAETAHRACTLDFFKRNQFDYLIASIPAHVPLFKKLIAEFQPNAKLIIQQGNNWVEDYDGENILASRAPTITDNLNNVVYYHQEFDLTLFKSNKPPLEKGIFSFVNVIQNTGIGWEDYKDLKKTMPGFRFKAFGGQCPDGNMTGPRAVADAMAHADFIFHVKPGGDGFGHVIHSAYAAGRPIITRSSHYNNQLAASLLQDGTYLHIDKLGRKGVAKDIKWLYEHPEELEAMGNRARARFYDVVDYNAEAKEIWTWLQTLN